jgi:hypothetical protein
VLTIDPARRLADALGLAGLTTTGGGDELPRDAPQGSLRALMLDRPRPSTTWCDAGQRPARREALFANRYYQHMSRSLAGTLEYMAVERLHDLTARSVRRHRPRHPADPNALDFLEAPEKIASFLHRVVRG